MSHKRLRIAAAIIALVLVVSFVFSVPRTGDVAQEPTANVEAAKTPTVTVRDSFKKGVHTITGSFEAPNACTTITADATVVGDTPETEEILVIISMPEDVGVCLQLPTRADFSTTLSAPAQMPIRATINGIVAEVTSI